MCLEVKTSELLLLVNEIYATVVCTESQNTLKPAKNHSNKDFDRIKHDCMFSDIGCYELLNNLKG